jgi:hypothetical protein
VPQQVFRFEPRQLRRLRAIQTARLESEMWSVNEFQAFSRGMPLRPARSWRMSANPNPWDAALAFDNSAVTRWRSWDGGRPGMYIEVDFGEPLLIDEVRVAATPDAARAQVDLRGMDARGEWRPLAVQRSSSSLRAGDDLRQASVQALAARGIHYLMVTPGAFGANDFVANAAAWGIKLLGESGGRRLYALNRAGTGHPALEPATVSRPAAPPGMYDDPDSRICLRAAWTRDTFRARRPRLLFMGTRLPTFTPALPIGELQRFSLTAA